MANIYGAPAPENPPEDDAGGMPGGTPGGDAGNAGGLAGPPEPGPVLTALQTGQGGMQPSAQGPGDVARGTLLVSQAMDMLHQAATLLPNGSPQQQAVHRSLQQLGRHMPQQGASTTGPAMTEMQGLLGQLGKNPMLQAMGQRLMQGGGAPGQPAAPMPSTPLPGA